MPFSALVTLALISVWRGAFSASTKLLAKVLTSTPEPEPKELISFAAADLAAVLPVGVPLAADVVADDVVAVTMIVIATAYLIKLNKFN